MWDIFLPKAALALGSAGAAVGGGALLGGRLAGGAVAARAARLAGPAGLSAALVPVVGALAFPGLTAHALFFALAALAPLGCGLVVAGRRAAPLGWIGAVLAALGPPVLLGWMGEMSPLMGIVGGLHGAIGATLLGLAGALAWAPEAELLAPRGRRALLVLALAAPLMGGLGLRAAGEAAPLTLAALGAHWQDGAAVGLPLGALPRELQAENIPAGVVLPRVLSLAGRWSPDAPLVGAAAWPMEQRPPVVVLHLGLWAMIGGGLAALIGALAAQRAAPARRALRVALWGAAVAEGAGLIIVELGRGPFLLRPALTYGAALPAAPLGLPVGLSALALTLFAFAWARRRARAA